MKLSRSIIRACFVLLISAICTLAVETIQTETLAKTVEGFFDQFAKAYAAKDKIALGTLLNKSQQKWCFKELDGRGSADTNVALIIKIDPKSLQKEGTKIVVMTSVVREINNRKQAAQHLLFTLEDANGTLQMTDCSNPQVEQQNDLTKRADDLGVEFETAVNNTNMADLCRLLQVQQTSDLTNAVPWIGLALQKNSPRLALLSTANKSGKYILEFGIPANSNVNERYSLTMVSRQTPQGPSYYLALEPASRSPTGSAMETEK